ncbi:MAG: bifunctional proline dehydrogenase/L-glutamate gamma-semialdehyde dehydrogenase PutA [Paracoccaceae bacterium]|nr:bifunctional proline dehydrogenase/L-glutamate gamma-semialdehyde dehydrogenase PutA [Paracoccaceae bacterium]
MNDPDGLRAIVHRTRHQTESAILDRLLADTGPSATIRLQASARAARLVETIREASRPGLMEVFLAEYGLSTDEGIALMCLAEAMLRVPDAPTIDALIEDKIAPSRWSEHLGRSSSALVNASTWALMLTGRTLRDGDPDSEGIAAVLRSLLKRLGEPVIRSAVRRAMVEFGRQFVLGEDIGEAMHRAAAKGREGFTHSYDMLGEAAVTAADADRYFAAYADAISRISARCTADDVRANPGISVKLSALHPRFEMVQAGRVTGALVERLGDLARQACTAGMGLNIDAEEADRLDLTLDVAQEVVRDPALAGWDGFGLVVQAYGKRAGPVIDWLEAQARHLDRRIMVRLVKGAYWDTEIKRAQVNGASGFPVFSRKAATDVSFICCAAKLLRFGDRIYAQFATHNAHTVATILELMREERVPRSAFEFQRLHGMGEALHDRVRSEFGTRCRIYAPVGRHRDLLAYLVRRLLENGANSSFVNQIVDTTIPAATLAKDPFAMLETARRHPSVRLPADLYAPERVNSRGWELWDPLDRAAIETARLPFRTATWEAGPITCDGAAGEDPVAVVSPANPADHVGSVAQSTGAEIDAALAAARVWDDDSSGRARILVRASELYEANVGEFLAVLCREAGKTPSDAVAELREAVDFLRYYGARGRDLAGPPRGVIACISPWNFPLAIFTGQIAGALAAGNAVLAKPAEATGLVAALAVRLMHEAGVPRDTLQLLTGRGSVVGPRLFRNPVVKGVCFTGSTATAQAINRMMSDHLDPTAPLIAETGGLNAMIVDSTALPEQAITDILASAFQSAGQRCSALRMLYLQSDIAPSFLDRLEGAMDALVVGDPWGFDTDVGPVIDRGARADIESHIEAARRDGRLRKRLPVPGTGDFVGPSLIEVGGIADLGREVFGPVLHVATFDADSLDLVIGAINATGYGLTFGIHSRIDSRIERVVSSIRAGNLYVNRNQIGAVVGSQPFGGEGLSGTGPKAGGPNYVRRLTRPPFPIPGDVPGPSRICGDAGPINPSTVQDRIDSLVPGPDAELESVILPGPTGESNRFSLYGRGVILCLGPTAAQAARQAQTAAECGCRAVAVAPGVTANVGIDGKLHSSDLLRLSGFDAVAFWGEASALRDIRRALAARSGRLIALMAESDMAERCRLERHVCADVTAAGGNASLLAQAS